MKTSKTILFILALFFLYSCSDCNETCIVVINNDRNNLAGKIAIEWDTNKYTPETTDKFLIFRILQDEPAYYLLKIGDFSANLYLTLGDSIFLSSNIKTPAENISFTGKGSLLNNYLLSNKYLIEQLDEETDFDAIFSLSPLEFTRAIDSLYNIRNAYLNKFISTNNIKDENFIKTEQKRIFYEVSIKKNLYYRDFKFLTGQPPILNNHFKRYLTEADFNDSTLMHMDEYRNFLYTYFESVALQQLDLKKDQKINQSFTETSYQIAIEKISNSAIRDYVLYRIMNIHLNETELNKLGKLIDDFNIKCKNREFKKKINVYYSKLKRLKHGMPAPEFCFPDTNGQKRSLSNFKGKLVYIDVWNSYCSPCFKEFAFIEKLIKKYEDKNIVFIGISFDSEQKQWLSTVKKKKLLGVQLFANGWNHQFGKEYLVFSNPRFILIDQDGKFISSKAPKASEDIEELFDKYLK